MPQDWFSQFQVVKPAKPQTTHVTAKISSDDDDWFSQFAAADALTREAGVSAHIQPLPREPVQEQPGMLSRAADFTGDVAIGAAKGLGSTVFGLGKVVRDYTPIGRISDAINPGAFDERPPELTPTNTAQRIGYTGEQIGEFFTPAGAVSRAAQGSKLARAGLEAVTAAPLALLQGSGSGGAAATGALAAAIPGVGALTQRLPTGLKQSAQKQVVQALGPTKERFKAMAERLAPQMLRRGIRGSRESIVAKAADAADDAGQAIDAALQQFGSRPVGVQPIIDALETAKDAFRVVTQKPLGQVAAQGRTANVRSVANGVADVVVEIEPRAIRQLDALQTLVQDLGPNARVDQLVSVRRAWDRIVDQAGGFQHRAGGAIGMPLKDQSEAAVKREGAAAIRRLLDVEVPELTILNKEFSFWKGLEDVLTQTLKRTQPQGTGLLRQGAEMAGQVVGGVAGSSAGVPGTIGGAFALGKLSKFAQSVFTSPRWRIASAQAKDALADAIMSGNTNKVAAALGRIMAGSPAQITR